MEADGHDADPLFDLLERGVIRVALDVQQEQADLRLLMRRYRNRPYVACKRLSGSVIELETAGEVFTLDSDFRIYRRHGNRAIPVVMPE